jgi:hypothetical protein
LEVICVVMGADPEVGARRQIGVVLSRCGGRRFPGGGIQVAAPVCVRHIQAGSEEDGVLWRRRHIMLPGSGLWRAKPATLLRKRRQWPGKKT